MNLRNTLTALACTTLAACVVAGTAWGATAGWQDVWNQIKPILSTPGTVNATDNPVHWTKLKGVPAGLADGLDDGDKAGFGLKKNVFPELNLAIDETKVQRKLTAPCTGAKAIQSVATDGTVTCVAGGAAVYSGSKHDGYGVVIGEHFSRLGGSLDVPAGVWSVVAQSRISEITDIDAECQLEARTGDSVVVGDNGLWGVDSPENGAASLSVVLTMVYTAKADWQVSMRCKDWNYGDDAFGHLYWKDVKITATQVGELHASTLKY